MRDDGPKLELSLMPGLFDNALAYENQSRMLRANNKLALEQQRQQDMMTRMFMPAGAGRQPDAAFPGNG